MAGEDVHIGIPSSRAVATNRVISALPLVRVNDRLCAELSYQVRSRRFVT